MNPEQNYPFADAHPFGAGQRAASGGGGPQFARPISDVSKSGYFPSSGSDCFAMLDEVVPDDADYIVSNSTGAIVSLQLTALTDPGFDTDHTLRFRGADVTVGSQSIACDLYCGLTFIESLVLPPTATPTTVAATLNPTNVANITNYADLRASIRDEAIAVKGAQRRVYWVELQVGV